MDSSGSRLTATKVSGGLGVSQPAVSILAKRVEKIALAENLKLVDGKKVIILWTSPKLYFGLLNIETQKSNTAPYIYMYKHEM